jgi:hypothetical protein
VDVKQSIGVMLIGLLFGLFGLVFAGNLFGVADEHARNVFNRTKWIRQSPPWKWAVDPDPQKELRGTRVWVRVHGAIFMLAGIAILSAGTVALINALA